MRARVCLSSRRVDWSFAARAVLAAEDVGAEEVVVEAAKAMEKGRAVGAVVAVGEAREMEEM